MMLTRGRTYRAKKPAHVNGFVNDRTLLHVGVFTVQYDGPAVADGARYPQVRIEAFEKWAAEDVTDQLPTGDYQTWADYLASKKAAAKEDRRG